MQVTAYQDPETGRLFPNERTLREFQKEQNRKKEQAERKKEAFLQAEVTKKLMVQELRSKKQFPELTKRMYEAAIATYELRKKATPPAVLSVNVWDWKLYTSAAGELMLRTKIRVALSHPPEKVLKGWSISLGPSAILHPFRACEGSARPQEGGSYAYIYCIEAFLDDLPAFKAACAELKELIEKSREHESRLKEATQKVLEQDALFKALQIRQAKAMEEFQKAEKALAEVTAELKAREDLARATAGAGQGFEEEGRLAELCMDVGVTADAYVDLMAKYKEGATF